MSSVFADHWFPFRVGDYTRRSAGLHPIFFDSLFSGLGARAMVCIDYQSWRLLAFWGARFGRFSHPTRLQNYKRLYSDIFEHFGSVRQILEGNVQKYEALSRREVIRVHLDNSVGLGDYDIRIYIIDKYAFVLFIAKATFQRGVSEKSVRDRALRAIEYIDRAQPFFDNIPYQMFQVELADNQKLFEEYFGPHSFCPHNESDIEFLWPWQRSLVAESPTSIRRRGIPTTSLVFDLRNSTTAMMQSRDPERFSDFISDVIDAAKSEIVLNGGFFDKETGDGIVGHFCEDVSSFLFGEGRTQAQALAAACKIREKIKRLIDGYQENLNHGIGSFGPAIGIHNSRAVWIFSRHGIRAIGEAVVGATRLCKNAKAGEIIVSNGFVRTITGAKDTTVKVENFKRRKLVYAEIKAEAGPYGYVYSDEKLPMVLQ